MDEAIPLLQSRQMHSQDSVDAKPAPGMAAD
jgi:hypothetical protein